MFDPCKDNSLAVINEKLQIKEEITPNYPRKSISDLNRLEIDAIEFDKSNDLASLFMGTEETEASL